MQSTFRKSTVLVIEPDSDILHVIRYHLSKAGFEVLTVSNGHMALDLLHTRPVDLIVSDAAMPDMRGFSLRKRLFLDPGTRDIPFLFLLPSAHPEKELPVLRNALDSWLAKPFDPLHLIARVESLLSRQRTHAELVRIDPLTRVLNLPSIEREVAADLKRVQRYNRSASIALIDVDHFSQVNEQRGFASGDLLLSSLASIIVGNIRAADLAGRFGGGKFVLYLPETPVDGARTVLQRIQDQIARAAEELIGQGASFCAGIAEAPRHGVELPLLYQRVVEALDTAKSQGPAHLAVCGAASQSPN